ncbi:MAG: IclR family transcriptional regulator [bacterium]
MRRPRSSPTRRIQSVGRAIDILFALARAREPQSPSEVAALLGLERTTVHRLMVTLAASRLLRFDPETRKYRIGAGALELGAAYLRGQIHDRVVERVVSDVAEEVRQTVSLGALVDDEVIIMVAREAEETLTVTSRAGDRLPAHGTAIGKLFLAERRETEIREFLAQTGMPRLTPQTITTVTEFLQEIEEVRAQGIAYAREEAKVGISSIAVPVRRHDGPLVAGLVVAVPAQFATAEMFEKLLPPLRRAAKRIEAAGVV